MAEGRDARVLDALAWACGDSLLDVHADVDHHRSVYTLAGPGPRDAEGAVRSLARVVAERVDLTRHDGVHPRMGALDVVPFVALDGLGGSAASDAVDAAHAFGAWAAAELAVPVFFYGDADPQGRSLPALRRDAFTVRPPDAGPAEPHARLGAIAVGVRPVLVAVNCELATGDIATARAIVRAVRERDGGLRGVRALGLSLSSRERAAGVDEPRRPRGDRDPARVRDGARPRAWRAAPTSCASSWSASRRKPRWRVSTTRSASGAVSGPSRRSRRASACVGETVSRRARIAGPWRRSRAG